LKDGDLVELLWVYRALKAALGVRQKKGDEAVHEMADLLETFCRVASSTSSERTAMAAFIAADPMPQPVSSPNND
jgi:hypothetical protein